MANLSRFGGVPRSSIFLSEQAGAQADSAGYGQFWVDTDSRPRFTDEAGVDLKLGGGTHIDYIDAASGRLIAWLASGATGPTYQTGAVDAAQPYFYVSLPHITQPNLTINTVLPRRWNGGTVRLRFYWKQEAAGTGGIYLVCGTTSANDEESMLVTVGGYQGVTDTAPNDVNKLMVTNWTSAMTIQHSPTTGAMIQFYCARQIAHASDTLAQTVRILGVELEWVSSAPTDD